MNEFVRFYQGEESTYQTAKEQNKLENCFYFTEDVNRYRLYLNEHKIFDSNNQEDLANAIINTRNFAEKIKNYLPITGGRLTGALEIDETLNVTGGISVTNGKISAENFKDEGEQVTIPCALFVDNDTTIKGLLTLEKLQLDNGGTLKNCNLTNVINLSFANDATLTNLPTYKTQQNYEFDFNNANLKVNRIDAQSITIKDSAVSTQDNTTQVFSSIQIGSIILSDDGKGNLAITSVEQ